MKKLVVGFWILLIAAGCKVEQTSENYQPGLQSVVWTQYSAEVDALYFQAYNFATSRLLSYTPVSDETALAVTLDIDETVLDNSPYNAQMLKAKQKYSTESWNEWCNKRSAKPLPGALEFTLLADSLGVEVFYISNRSVNVLEATIDNLVKFGFPNADADHVLLKTESSSKDERRARVQESYDIVLLLGDNLGDFDGLFDNRTLNYGKETVKNNSESFGSRYIVFPNPMYGSWERAVYPDGFPERAEIISSLRDQ